MEGVERDLDSLLKGAPIDADVVDLIPEGMGKEPVDPDHFSHHL